MEQQPLKSFDCSLMGVSLSNSVLGLDLGLMGSLLPNALRSFKIYCASPSITFQLVLFLWQTFEIDPLGHVRVVEALQNFVQKCDYYPISITTNLKKTETEEGT